MSDPSFESSVVSRLDEFQNLYPTTNPTQNPWYLVAAVSFTGCNRSEAIPLIFKHVMASLSDSDSATKLLTARRMRDGIFKGGVLTGFNKAINSLISLNEVMPEELKDKEVTRRTTFTAEELTARGQEVFTGLYGDNAENVHNLLHDIYPDMAFFSKTLTYGWTYDTPEILDPMLTSYCLIAALIVGDTPRQIRWHIDNARRNGATLEQAKAVREMTMRIGRMCGVTWRDGVPEVL